ncbi:Suppressor of Mek1 [Pyrenophora tritici-repentis]|uniref:PP4R3 EVH1-like domain-containing protein n=1 Tax=Pyrenophora tritici-repentis TaxID=45151 RepID=A0A2W1EWJ9_9PLEO|nr:Suppressor of Mek1 [Pyrenophora tritici-repentis]KAF7567929.1 hypothetical protein PtrM4_125420 [Pyrenophora tritici-repentis]KAI1533397.1 suppressor of Mek1 [Pyrenophora tritici-repentis]KAI1548744.1 hypothetical protein PtrSN001C_001962 [Pyrenophora tritici-repentis]KAI1584773.1 suppressor of Mek1 [Pyrenophora tritici-repentis]
MANVGPPPASERKRVKVYELKNNDWFDRGTGFCKGVVANQEEARIVVLSEDDQSRQLLETRISKDDGYQKQQGMRARRRTRPRSRDDNN